MRAGGPVLVLQQYQVLGQLGRAFSDVDLAEQYDGIR